MIKNMLSDERHSTDIDTDEGCRVAQGTSALMHVHIFRNVSNTVVVGSKRAL
jgi:hypothetical protein